MLKGKIEIKLKDVESGEEKVYVKENMVTNAVQETLDWCIKALDITYYNSGDDTTSNLTEKSRCFPISEKLLGGIILFQKPIMPVEKTNMALPFDCTDTSIDTTGDEFKNTDVLNKIVGYATSVAGEYREDDSRMGEVLTTSGATEQTSDGYRFVYNFAPNKANGEIAAVALTSQECGICPFFISNYVKSSIELKEEKASSPLLQAADYDFENNIVTCIHPPTPAGGSYTSIVIEKYKIPFDTFTLNSKFANPKFINKQTINGLDYFLEKPDYDSYLDMKYSVCSDNDNYYLVTQDYKKTITKENKEKIDFNKSVFKIYIIDKQTLGTKFFKIDIQNTKAIEIYIFFFQSACDANKNLYIYNYNNYDDRKGCYMIDVSNIQNGETVDFTEINFSGLYNSMLYKPIVFNNGQLIWYRNYIQYQNYICEIPETIGTKKYTNHPIQGTAFMHDSGKYISFDIGSLTNYSTVDVIVGHTKQYLGTIVNLTESETPGIQPPVHKQIGQTMTVTYTITDTGA